MSRLLLVAALGLGLVGCAPTEPCQHWHAVTTAVQDSTGTVVHWETTYTCEDGGQ